MKMKIALVTTSIGIALVSVIPEADAQLYRCTNADGRVVYTDRKCAPDAQRQTVKITDNAMDNSNLQSTAAIRAELDNAMAAQGGEVAVIGNSASSSASSSAAPRPVRRRCGR